MFDRLTIRGATASIVWGYRTTAALAAWTISKDVSPAGTRWILRATPAGTIDRFILGQTKPALMFTAPRHYGQSCWPVVGPVVIREHEVVATLGPPEQ